MHVGRVNLEANAARKGESQDINVFVDAVKPSGTPPPGLPQFNPNRVVGPPTVEHSWSVSHGFS